VYGGIERFLVVVGKTDLGLRRKAYSWGAHVTVGVVWI
jgi:hypothetical protein